MGMIKYKSKYAEANDPKIFLIKYDFSSLAFSLEMCLSFSEPNTKNAGKTMVGHSSYWLNWNSKERKKKKK